MSDKDHIKELFQSKLGNMETPVDPSLWAGIQSQLPAVGATAAKGLSVAAKWIIGLTSAAVVTTATVILLNDNNSPAEKPADTSLEQITSVQEENNTVNSNEGDQVQLTELSTDNSQKETSSETITTGLTELPQEEIIENTPNLPVQLERDYLAEEDNPLKHVKLNEEEKEKPVQENDQTENLPEEKLEEKNEVKEAVKIELPDIFTPNGDYQNDVLFIKDYNLKDFSMVVLNAANQIVYRTNDPHFRWDGTDMFGSPVTDGNYVYMVTGYDENGLPVNASSLLKIVR